MHQIMWGNSQFWGKNYQPSSQTPTFTIETGVLNIQTPLKFTTFILHILILSWIIPKQE